MADTSVVGIGPSASGTNAAGSSSSGSSANSATNAQLAAKVVAASTLRNLGDRSYEKRKAAALEIEHAIKELQTNAKAAAAAATAATTNGAPSGGGALTVSSAAESIKAILNVLKEFAYSTQSNQRKGGLIGLAAAAIALADDTQTYLEHLLPRNMPVLGESRRR
jgi:vacuole morphology and inheritance protein 14